jgi:phosphomannomutase
VADAGNGMSGLLLPEVAKRIGGEIVPLYWELNGNFPNHEANPLEEKNMKDVQTAVLKEQANFGVAFDGDSDRVFFCTEEGVTVPGDIATGLIAQELLKENPGASILYDLRSSRMTKEMIEAAGGQAIMCKVGHSYIKKQMRETGAIFAGELSGHFYFVPTYAESAMHALMCITRLVQESGKSLSEIVKPLLKYAKTPEINFEVTDKLAAIKRIKEKYADAEIMELDGVTVSYQDWWANVRMSGTEPLLRLNMEAITPELLQAKQSEIEDLITTK